MFARMEDFAAEWERESGLTMQVLNALTDESLAQRIGPDYRSLGDLAWHLADSLKFLSILGLSIEAPAADERPESAAALADCYRRVSAQVLDAVRTQWTDESLADTVDISGNTWKNADTLRFTVMHQAHHRGQMTVLMRQAGLRAPGIYGQTREDWIEMGREPLK